MDCIQYAKTNFFRVRDREKFLEWAEENGLRTVSRADGAFAAAPPAGSTDGFSLCSEDGHDIFAGELAKHLEDGSVAVCTEIGFQMAACGGPEDLAGRAVAVNWKGETEEIDLRDIFDRARRAFGVMPDRD